MISSTPNPSSAQSAKETIHYLNQQALGLIDDDPKAGLMLARQALELALWHQDAQGGFEIHIAQSYLGVGRFQMQLSCYPEALEAFELAHSQYELINHPRQAALCLSYVGTALAYLGDFPQAQAYFYNAIEQAQQAGDSQLEAEVLNDLGYSFVVMGRFTDALPLLTRSLAFFRESGSKIPLCWVLDSLCSAYLGLNDFPQARAYQIELIRLCRETHQWKTFCEHLIHWGQAFNRLNQPQKAAHTIRLALRKARLYGYRNAEALALHALGSIQNTPLSFSESESLLIQGLAIAQEIGSRPIELDSYYALAELYKTHANFEQAVLYFERFHQCKEQLYSEQTDTQLKNLHAAFQLRQARQEAEILQLRNHELYEEISRRTRAQQLLEEVASTDTLTGLLTRRSWLSQAHSILLREAQQENWSSIVLLDLDFFKRINDEYGHSAGDDLLVAFSSRLILSLRPQDLAGRFGGEEIIILFPNTRPAEAERLLNRLRDMLSTSTLIAELPEIHVTFSAGITSLPPGDSFALPVLLNQADQALYAAKRAGRNRNQIFGAPESFPSPQK